MTNITFYPDGTTVTREDTDEEKAMYAADAARASAKADLIGGIGGLLDAGVAAASGGLIGGPGLQNAAKALQGGG